MNFLVKAYLQKFLSQLPGTLGAECNYFLQKNITKKIFVAEKDFNTIFEVKVLQHFNTFNKYLPNKKPEECTYFEFGAGWDLFAPIGFSHLGFKNIQIIDIQKLVQCELINHTIDLYKSLGLKNNIKLDKSNYLKVLSENFRINYNAPCDARKTDFPNNSIDFIVSNVTMEHIPSVDIVKILKECHRILNGGGVLSLTIDYTDHYSYFDKSISVYNYLKYSPQEWANINSSLHYQNRLRHIDYLKLFEAANFEVLLSEEYLPEQDQLRILDTFAIHECFKSYSLEEIKPISGYFVLKK